MVIRRSALAVVCAVAVGSVTLLAQKGDQQNKGKPSDAQKKELQVLVKSVDDAVAGQPTANDLSLIWLRDDVLKAQNNKQYVPFTVSIDPSKISGGFAALYWRVVPKAAAAPPPTVGKKDDKKDSKKIEFPYEDFGPIQITSGQNKISRSLTVAGGEYDVWIALKELTPEKAPKNTPPSKVSILKHPITIPDLWNGELNTSSVIVAQRIDPLAAPLTQQQQIERPYALGTMEIVPVLDSKFSKKNELSTFVLIYNAKTDSGNKPDIVVEYNFYAKQSGAEKFFNKTNPQSLNAQTLPPQFDLAAGHQLQSGQAVPLSSFPEGEYRLEIKVTDKIANKTLTRDVNFSVSAS